MANPNVVNKSNGPVIASPQVVPIIWGNGWPYDGSTLPDGSTLAANLLAFVQFIVGPDSPQMSMLAEYGTSSISITSGGVLGNKIITAPGNPLPSLTDKNIQDTLQRWISNASNLTPGFPQPGPNVIYMLFLPQGIGVTDQAGNASCVVFNGYHWFSGNLLYAVLPCCLPASTPLSAVLTMLTTVCSHELGEAITDPDNNGWLDTNINPKNGHDEIGDVC